MKAEEDAARALLSPLRDEAVPPSKVEVGRLVAAGRRRLRVRRWAGASGAVALTVGVAVGAVSLIAPGRVEAPASSATPAVVGPPTFPLSCTAKLLPVPEHGDSSWVLSGDPTGRYLVGAWVDGQRRFRPVLWDRGVAKVIDAPGKDLAGIAVNSSGVVAGSSESTDRAVPELVNWIYRDGTISQLGEVLYERKNFIRVVGINSRGDILADSPYSGETEFVPARPGVWRAAGAGGFHELEIPAGLREVAVTDIDDDGTVLGRYTVGPAATDERGLLWTSDGKARMPAVPEGLGPGGAFRSLRGGWAVGTFQQPGKQPQEGMSVLRNLRTGQDIRLRTMTYASAVNAHGVVAGVIRPNAVDAPAIATGARVLPLPLPGGGSLGGQHMVAMHLSDDARTVAGVLIGTTKRRAVLWSCQ